MSMSPEDDDMEFEVEEPEGFEPDEEEEGDHGAFGGGRGGGMGKGATPKGGGVRPKPAVKSVLKALKKTPTKTPTKTTSAPLAKQGASKLLSSSVKSTKSIGSKPSGTTSKPASGLQKAKAAPSAPKPTAAVPKSSKGPSTPKNSSIAPKSPSKSVTGLKVSKPASTVKPTTPKVSKAVSTVQKSPSVKPATSSVQKAPVSMRVKGKAEIGQRDKVTRVADAAASRRERAAAKLKEVKQAATTDRLIAAKHATQTAIQTGEKAARKKSVVENVKTAVKKSIAAYEPTERLVHSGEENFMGGDELLPKHTQVMARKQLDQLTYPGPPQTQEASLEELFFRSR